MNETERILNEVESRLKACIKQLDSIDDDYNRTYLFGQRQALIGMKEYIEAMLKEPASDSDEEIERLSPMVEQFSSYFAKH